MISQKKSVPLKDIVLCIAVGQEIMVGVVRRAAEELKVGTRVTITHLKLKDDDPVGRKKELNYLDMCLQV